MDFSNKAKFVCLLYCIKLRITQYISLIKLHVHSRLICTLPITTTTNRITKQTNIDVRLNYLERNFMIK